MEKKFLNWHKKEDREIIIQSLQNENIVLSSTDTVLGLLSVVSQKAFDQINDIKERREKSYLILIPSKELVATFAIIQNENIAKIMELCWPGPVTLILKAKKGIPSFLISQEGTIAFRVPDHQALQSVMMQTGPLFSTSANKTGKPVPQDIHEVDKTIVQQVAYIITDEKRTPLPSTILDCSQERAIRVVREGAYPIKDLERIVGGQLSK